jgi:hypothetical protein
MITTVDPPYPDSLWPRASRAPPGSWEFRPGTLRDAVRDPMSAHLSRTSLVVDHHVSFYPDLAIDMIGQIIILCWPFCLEPSRLGVIV